MNDEQYMTHLYDRAAQRLGYPTYQAQRADMDAADKARRDKAEADKRADMEEWATAQLNA